MGTSNRVSSDRVSLYLWIIVLTGIAVLGYWNKSPRIVWDMTWYMSVAANILSGNGYVEANGVATSLTFARGPIFPLLISAFLAIDYSVEWAFLPVMIAWVSVPATLFIFCNSLTDLDAAGLWGTTKYRTLDGRTWGITSALLAMSIWAVAFWSLRHIDIIWILFSAWAMIFFIWAIICNSKALIVLYSAFTGMMTAVAYLTKESALIYLVFFFLFALSARLPLFRLTRFAAGFAGGFLLLVLPWFVFVYLKIGSFDFLGVQGDAVLQRIFLEIFDKTSPPIDNIIKLINGILFEQRNSFGAQIPFGGIFIYAWMALPFLLVLRRPSVIFLFLAAGAGMPVVVYNAIVGWRFAYNLQYLFFAIPIVTYFMLLIIDYLLRRSKSGRFNPMLIAIIFASLFSGYLIFEPNDQDRSTAQLISSTSIFSKSDLSLKRYGVYFDPTIISRLVDLRSEYRHLAVDLPPLASAFQFHLKGSLVESPPYVFKFQDRLVFRGRGQIDLTGKTANNAKNTTSYYLLSLSMFDSWLNSTSATHLVTSGFFPAATDMLAAEGRINMVKEFKVGRLQFKVWRLH